ncbi:MAG: class I tRNA ligase family protein, partial [Candidatus Eremiobacteraeota bacterium]|nr:class I tRNA ligase family protein [Candidatus Eremiobacteraeota bacterium]
FNNKIWNATRYVLQLPEGLPGALVLPQPSQLGLADKWILTRLHDVTVSVSKDLNRYDFGTVAETLWKFVWYEFCDWYLEATKIKSETRAAILSFVLNNTMRLLHPVEPFITEEVWLHVPHDGASIMTASWPDTAEIPVDREAAARFEALQQTVERIRNLRAEMGLAPRAPLTVEIPNALPDETAGLLALYVSGTPERTDIPASSFEDALASVSARAPRELMLERYRKDHAKLLVEIERIEQKLADEKFVGKAPVHVVNKEREKLEAFRSDLSRTQAEIGKLGEPV